MNPINKTVAFSNTFPYLNQTPQFNSLLLIPLKYQIKPNEIPSRFPLASQLTL